MDRRVQQLGLGLARALSGRTNRHAWGDDFSHLVPTLLPVFFDVLSALGDPALLKTRDPTADAAERQGDIANALGRKTFQLIKLIKKHRKAIEEAVKAGYLRSPRLDSVRTLGDFMGIGRAWATGAATTTALKAMLEEIGAWELAARSGARRRPGPNPTQRIRVVEFIGLQLQECSIPLTKGKAGYFGRVVEVLYRAAGLNTGTVYRDIQEALKYHLLCHSPRSRTRIST
jgi:hypothetical protein